MILKAYEPRERTVHPAGVYTAVCVDVVDLGLMPIEYLGKVQLKRRARLVFETRSANGEPRWLARAFTASIHPNSRLSQAAAQWRGRPLAPGEDLDLTKMIGVSATLAVSHVQGADGQTFASIDAITRPTQKLTPSGKYDPQIARERVRQAQASGTVTASSVAAPSATPRAEFDDVGF